MPMGMFDLHVEHMPKLLAREALHDGTVVAFGSKSLDASTHRSIRRSWVTQAELDPPKVKPKNAKDMTAVLGMMGIGVRRA